ncbi:MAG: hypothetical protein WC867_06620 [Candidatus Pacearchaeota archaeon]|jgi:hypothetical protein
MILHYRKNNEFDSIVECCTKQNRTILIDASSSDSHDLSGYLKIVEDVRAIESDVLFKNTWALSDFHYLLMNDRSYTIPEVTDELFCLKKIVGRERFRLLNGYSQVVDKKKDDLDPVFTKNSKLIQNIHDLVSIVHNTSKSKELIIEDENYSLIYDLMNVVSKFYNCKIDNSYLKHERDFIKDSDTDEKLVSASLWVASELKEKTSIITSDKDFLRLIGRFINEIKDKDLPSYFSSLYEKIQENPPLIFFIDRNKDIYGNRAISRFDPNKLAYQSKKKHRTEIQSKANRSLINQKLVDELFKRNK